jgi:hypothetical protein
MPFIPASPTAASTWSATGNTSASSWADEVIPDVFTVLADIDGNVIADSSGTEVNLFGGYDTDVASTGASWAGGSNGSTTWTPEG